MAGTEEIALDVRDLEPPEPFVQATAILAGLAPGQYLRMIAPRRPRLLYPWLEQHGFSERTLAREAELFEIFIWRTEDEETGAALTGTGA